MRDVEETVGGYFSMWNETDGAKRLSIIEGLWTEDGVSADPIAHVKGFSEIDAMVAKVQKDYPDHRFSLVGEITGHNDRAHFQWQMEDGNGDVQLAGRDFIRLENGRIADLAGFWL